MKVRKWKTKAGEKGKNRVRENTKNKMRGYEYWISYLIGTPPTVHCPSCLWWKNEEGKASSPEGFYEFPFPQFS
jgi:hypothetical protein